MPTTKKAVKKATKKAAVGAAPKPARPPEAPEVEDLKESHRKIVDAIAEINSRAVAAGDPKKQNELLAEVSRLEDKDTEVRALIFHERTARFVKAKAALEKTNTRLKAVIGDLKKHAETMQRISAFIDAVTELIKVVRGKL